MAPPTTPHSGKLHSKDHHHQNPTTPAKTSIKHRLNFSSGLRTPNPSSTNNIPTEHPVEVIGRIRDHPDRKETTTSALDIADDGRSVRVKTDIGYRDFGLDGISTAEEEDLDGFYKKFVESRIRGVKLGAKCTIMMYGPTGSGKSHTMFGCPKQPGIVYRALKDILGMEVDNAGFDAGLFVQVAVLEIYNEEIYDLLSGFNATGLQKPNAPKVRLEVMGKKAKNASYITGNEAGKISREVAKVEKRRIVKSTLCNERSSRSHCLIILDVPSVGGRLMLVDMAGSENFDQAGQTGFEAKMQTSKINQGNTALKRVVESIANGDSHVPFRDSKLTMLLQDSFEDDRTKILMILCASPDPKEMHKTISTLEYGAKAKCIVRVAHMPTPKDKMTSDGSSAVILGSRIAAMNQFIYKLQMENKQREKERDEAQKKLLQKEAELTGLREKLLKTMEGNGSAAREEELNLKVDERTLVLKIELERMREKMGQQQKELEALRQQLHKDFVAEMGGSRFLQRLSEACNEGDQGMEKSMELDMGDIPTIHDVKEVENTSCPLVSSACSGDGNRILSRFPGKVCLSTVFEGNEEEEMERDDVVKEVIEENISQQNFDFLNLLKEELNHHHNGHELDSKDSTASRSTRIQNIFRLCGNYREIAQQVKSKTPPTKKTTGSDQSSSPLLAVAELNQKSVGGKDKENSKPKDVSDEEGLVDVYVKWETSKELSGNPLLIKRFKVLNNASLSDVRKLIETHFNEENNREQQAFIFLLLGDPTGAPVSKDKEGMIPVSKLPDCNNQLSGGGLLACLRPVKRNIDDFPPLSSLDNKIHSALSPVKLLSPNQEPPYLSFHHLGRPSISEQL